MKLFIPKLAQNTTIRHVTDDDKNTLGLLGTIADMITLGILETGTAIAIEWVFIPTCNPHCLLFGENKQALKQQIQMMIDCGAVY